MTKEEYIKQAYAYGASKALQDVGYESNLADETAIKLANDLEGMHPAVRSLLQEPEENNNKTASALADALLKQ